jgi:hypothetical protein
VTNPPCVKCGCGEISGPRYLADSISLQGALVYACKRCGYSWRTSTLDKQSHASLEELASEGARRVIASDGDSHA